MMGRFKFVTSTAFFLQIGRTHTLGWAPNHHTNSCGLGAKPQQNMSGFGSQSTSTDNDGCGANPPHNLLWFGSRTTTQIVVALVPNHRTQLWFGPQLNNRQISCGLAHKPPKKKSFGTKTTTANSGSLGRTQIVVFVDPKPQQHICGLAPKPPHT